MLKLDNNLLQEIGLGALPEDQKRQMLQHIYETLELRVGTQLANQMTDKQLEEFERFIDAGGDANQAQALKWLESNLPNYKQVVNDVFEALKVEVKQMAPQLLASAQQQAAQAPAMPSDPMQPSTQPQQPAPSDPGQWGQAPQQPMPQPMSNQPDLSQQPWQPAPAAPGPMQQQTAAPMQPMGDNAAAWQQPPMPAQPQQADPSMPVGMAGQGQAAAIPDQPQTSNGNSPDGSFTPPPAPWSPGPTHN